MENIWGTADLRFLSLTEGVSTDHKFYGGITKFSVFSFLPIGVDAQKEPQAEFPSHLCVPWLGLRAIVMAALILAQETWACLEQSD